MPKGPKSPVFGANVRRLRKACGLSQEELADSMGLKQTDISRWEAGTVPSLTRIAALAVKLNATFDDLFVDLDRDYDARQQRPAVSPDAAWSLSPEERELVELWRSGNIEDEFRNYTLTVLRGFAARGRRRRAVS